MAETEKEVFRILVPVDGSASSDAAVRFAAQTARSMRAQIDVLYVSYFDHATDAAAQEEAKKRVDALCEKYPLYE